jgi:hypothetical protein
MPRARLLREGQPGNLPAEAQVHMGIRTYSLGQLGASNISLCCCGRARSEHFGPKPRDTRPEAPAAQLGAASWLWSPAIQWHSPSRQGARMTAVPVEPVADCRGEAGGELSRHRLSGR